MIKAGACQPGYPIRMDRDDDRDRKDRENQAAQSRLEKRLLEGLASGPAADWTEDDWAAIRERVTKRLEAK